MDRSEALETAKKLIFGDRAADYGDAWDNFKNIADLCNVVLQKKLAKPLTPADIATIMKMVKEARLINSPHHEDSFVDDLGYGAIRAELSEKQLTLGF